MKISPWEFTRLLKEKGYLEVTYKYSNCQLVVLVKVIDNGELVTTEFYFNDKEEVTKVIMMEPQGTSCIYKKGVI